jgi:hypothetical protein
VTSVATYSIVATLTYNKEGERNVRSIQANKRTVLNKLVTVLLLRSLLLGRIVIIYWYVFLKQI